MPFCAKLITSNTDGISKQDLRKLYLQNSRYAQFLFGFNSTIRQEPPPTLKVCASL